MIEFTKYMTHPDKPGVRAIMYYQEVVDRHLEGGWELEAVQESVQVAVQVEKPAPKKRRTRKPRS